MLSKYFYLFIYFIFTNEILTIKKLYFFFYFIINNNIFYYNY